MTMHKPTSQQMRVIFLPAITVLVLLAAASLVFNIEMQFITKDVAAIANMHPLSGILSNLGVILWSVTSAICFFSAILLYKNSAAKNQAHFIACSAYLSTYLLLDDFFQFHDGLASEYLGIYEKVIYLFLGIAVLKYLLHFKTIILNTHYFALLLAMTFLSSSVCIDAIVARWLWAPLGHWEYFIEDGLKWLGICCWCAYYVETCYQFIIHAFGLMNNNRLE